MIGQGVKSGLGRIGIARAADALLGPEGQRAAPTPKGALARRFVKSAMDAVLLRRPRSAAGSTAVEDVAVPATLRGIREQLAAELVAQTGRSVLIAQKAPEGSRSRAVKQIAALEEGVKGAGPYKGLSESVGLVVLRSLLEEFARRVHLAPRQACVHCGGCCWAMVFEPQLALRGRRHLVRALYEIDDLGRLFAMFAPNEGGTPDEGYWTPSWPVHALRRDEPSGLADEAARWDGVSAKIGPVAFRYYCAAATQIIESF